MTENKRFIYNKFDIVGNFEENELKLYEIDNNPSNDLDESNLFYVYSNSEANIENIVDKLNTLTNENEQLKQSYTKLKHRHSLLHDECLDAECDRDSYHKDVLSLEKENEQLKHRIAELQNDLNNYSEIYNELNALVDDNEQLKQQISYYEKLITDKEVEWLRDNTVWEQMPTSKRTFTKTTLSDKND